MNILRLTSDIIFSSRNTLILAFSACMLLMKPVGPVNAEGLAEYIQLALEKNHEIRAAHSRWEAAVEKIRQVGALPDPKLGAEYFLQPIETRTGPQEASLSLNQSIPWPTRLSKGKNVQRMESDIAWSRYLLTRQAVIRKVKETYIEYGFLWQAKEVTVHILELMQYLEGIARTNYTSGKTSYTDVLKIQIEIDRLKNRQHTLEDNAIPLKVQLNSLLSEERQTERPQPASMPEISLSRNEEEFFTLARQNSPRLKIAENTINKTKAALEVADQEGYPDLSVGIKTIFTGEAEFGDPPDSGQDPVIAGVTISVPLFRDKYRGAAAEKQASVRAARNLFEQTANDIEAEIEMTLFRYRKAQRLQKLYKDNLIPKIHQELDVALEAFQAGESSILELIDAEKNWLTFELARVRAQADMSIQIARLEELTGTTLVDWN